MAESTNKNGIDAYAQFEKWLGEQPYWLQDAAYRIYHRQPIDDDQIAAYAKMCVAQSKKEKPDYKKLPQNGTKIQAISEKMSVIRLSDVIGVNALALDANLNFSETGVTIVYGLNGAGKSGFMRIFKQLSGTRIWSIRNRQKHHLNTMTLKKSRKMFKLSRTGWMNLRAEPRTCKGEAL